MPPLSTTSTSTAGAGLVTVNPYVYLATLTHQETYALLAAAACLAIAGAILIQWDAALRLVSRRRRP